MSYKTIDFHVRGVAPLLMHNGQLANPMNRFAKAMKAIDDLETTVRADAGTGATAAVKPMVIASIVVGGVAALLAVTALIVAFRRSRPAARAVAGDLSAPARRRRR